MKVHLTYRRLLTWGVFTALLAALLLMASPCFVAKAIEVRPDVFGRGGSSGSVPFRQGWAEHVDHRMIKDGKLPAARARHDDGPFGADTA